MKVLVLDFLCVEGYKDVVETFAEESSCPMPDLPSDMEARMLLRNAIHRGDIPGAIAAINDVDPTVLGTPSVPSPKSVAG